jgi:UDP-glucose 4-epimerase
MNVNVRRTQNILAVCSVHMVENFVFASSAVVMAIVRCYHYPKTVLQSRYHLMALVKQKQKSWFHNTTILK